MTLSPKIFDTPKARAARERRYARADERQAHSKIADDIAFVMQSGHIDARLGVITVGAIYSNPPGARHACTWRCYLPMMAVSLQPAADLDKAKAALRFRVREWCEAAGLVISAAAMRRLDAERRV